MHKFLIDQMDDGFVASIMTKEYKSNELLYALYDPNEEKYVLNPYSFSVAHTKKPCLKTKNTIIDWQVFLHRINIVTEIHQFRIETVQSNKIEIMHDVINHIYAIETAIENKITEKSEYAKLTDFEPSKLYEYLDVENLPKYIGILIGKINLRTAPKTDRIIMNKELRKIFKGIKIFNLKITLDHYEQADVCLFMTNDLSRIVMTKMFQSENTSVYAYDTNKMVFL